MDVNGYKISFDRGGKDGLIPQVRGWYVCDPADTKHKKCIGPLDSESEAIDRVRRLPDLSPTPTDEQQPETPAS